MTVIRVLMLISLLVIEFKANSISYSLILPKTHRVLRCENKTYFSILVPLSISHKSQMDLEIRLKAIKKNSPHSGLLQPGTAILTS